MTVQDNLLTKFSALILLNVHFISQSFDRLGSKNLVRRCHIGYPFKMSFLCYPLI